MQPLLDVRDLIWTWIAGPTLVIVGLLLTVVLRAPQITRLAEGFRGTFAHDPTAPGTLPPPTVALLATAATWGSAAAVSAATAVSLGGPGALAWLWLAGLLIAPLRYAETLLARTAPLGKGGTQVRGSLATRLVQGGSPIPRALGVALLGLVPLAAFAWVGGAHGLAVTDAASQLLPGSEAPLGIAVAIASAILIALSIGPSLGWRISTAVPAGLGWLALAALLALFGVILAAILHDVGRALGGIGRAVEDALSGAESAGAFAGALAGEVAAAALIHMIPPLVATTGADGALHDAARAPTARAEAAASMIPPLLHVVLATLLGLSFLATGAFHRRVESSRPLSEVTLWRTAFETPSQRDEIDRRWSGTLRVRDGAPLARPLELATERGMITHPRFVQDGSAAADFAVQVRDGRITTLLLPGEHGTLEQAPLSTLSRFEVQGRMLPRGGRLLASSMERAGGDAAARIALTALLLLASIGAAGWGVATSRTIRGPLSVPAAFLPAVGILLAATGVAPWLGPVGAISAGVLSTIAALGIAWSARELSRR
jgi:AGCS family alanine or glycine:cation symporter